jgi:hypothetical protein
MSPLETPLPTGLHSISLALLNTEDGGQTHGGTPRTPRDMAAHPDCDRLGHGASGRFDPATTVVYPVQPMPRLSSHPQLTQRSHSQDKGTPGVQH